MAGASAGPHANHLLLTPDRQPGQRQDLITQSFYRTDALPDIQPTVSKNSRQGLKNINSTIRKTRMNEKQHFTFLLFAKQLVFNQLHFLGVINFRRLISSTCPSSHTDTPTFTFSKALIFKTSSKYIWTSISANHVCKNANLLQIMNRNNNYLYTRRVNTKNVFTKCNKVNKTKLVNKYRNMHSVNALVSINEVNLCWAQIVLVWVTVTRFDSRRQHFISICNQQPRSSQPSTSIGR